MAWQRLVTVPNLAGLAGLDAGGVFGDQTGAGPWTLVTTPADTLYLVTACTVYLVGGTAPTRAELRLVDDTAANRGILQIVAAPAPNTPMHLPGPVGLPAGWSLQLVLPGADATTRYRMSTAWMEGRWTRL